jgi:hypothetical protein
MNLNLNQGIFSNFQIKQTKHLDIFKNIRFRIWSHGTLNSNHGDFKPRVLKCKESFKCFSLILREFKINNLFENILN